MFRMVLRAGFLVAVLVGLMILGSATRSWS
jgi:hypothetical protein